MNDAHHSSQGGYLLVALAQKSRVNDVETKVQLVVKNNRGQVRNQLDRNRWCTGILAGMAVLEHQFVLMEVAAELWDEFDSL